MTARRWLSLSQPGGDEDFFSSILTEQQLADIFGAMHGLPALVLLSRDEEYVPPELNYPAVGRRLVAAMGPAARLHVVPGNHTLDGSEEEAAAVIADFIAALPS